MDAYQRRLCEQTLESAVAFAEDVTHLRQIVTRTDITPGEIRRASGTLIQCRYDMADIAHHEPSTNAASDIIQSTTPIVTALLPDFR